MPPARRPAGTIGDRRVSQPRKRKNTTDNQRRSARGARQDIDSEEAAHSDTADEILARSPPPDEPEYISKTTQKSGMFWAPLISGSTQEEKDLIQQELAAAGKFEFLERYHPEYVQTRMNDPVKLNRQHFYDTQDPGTRPVIAGVPNAPLSLDPPGTGSPFDALKHPRSLIAILNRVPSNPNGMPYGWDEKDLKKIPHSIMSKLPPKTLAAFPASVRSTFRHEIRARLLAEPAAVPMLPAVSRLTFQSQRLSNEGQEAEASSLRSLLQQPQAVEESSTRPKLPAISRSDPGIGGVLTSTYAVTSTSRDEAGSQEPGTLAPRRALVDYSDSDSEATGKTGAVTHQEDAATRRSEEPSASSMFPASAKLLRRKEHCPIEEDDDEQSNVGDLPAVKRKDEYQFFNNDEDIDPESLEDDEGSEEIVRLKLAAAEPILKLREVRKRKANPQAELLGGSMPQSGLTSATVASRLDARGSGSSAGPTSPAIHEASNNTWRRVTADRSLIRDSEDPTSPMLAEDSKRPRRSLTMSTDDPPRYAGLSITKRIYHSPRYSAPAASQHIPRRKPNSKLGGGGRVRNPAKVCDHCRIKSVKCDGVHPSCTQCDNYGVPCSFGGENEREGAEQVDHAQEQPPTGEEQRGESSMRWSPSDGDLQLDGVFDVVGDSGPTSHHPDTLHRRRDCIDFDDLRQRPFNPRLGLTKGLAGRFNYRSSSDHLFLQETTTVPLEFHPKPVFLHMPGFPKKTRLRTAHAYNEIRLPQEETFMTRPSVRIVVPDHLKNLLVDDWENVTKSMLVVPMPSKAPVNFIIDSYFDEEKGKRRLGSAEADVLEEFVAGMKVYFDKAIGKTLLYKFERPQWAEVSETAKPSRFFANST